MVQCNLCKLKGALYPEQCYVGHLKYLSVQNLLFTASPVVNIEQHSDHVLILTFPALAVKHFAKNSLHSTSSCRLVMTVTN